MNAHNDMRQRNRQLRAALDQSQLERAGESLAKRVIDLPEYQQAERIATYFAVNGEISLDVVEATSCLDSITDS